MAVDSSTLRDLEVFSSLDAEGMTLIALLDRTHSWVGREALRRRISTPVSDPARIVELQLAHQALAGESDAVRAALNDAELDAVAAYLGSRWEPARSRSRVARAAEAVWTGLRAKQFLQDAERGRDQVVALLTAATQLADLLSSSPSELVRENARAIRATTESLDLARLRDPGPRRATASTVLAFDQAARGPERPLLEDLVRQLAETEAMWSLGAATGEYGWSYPSVSSGACSARGLAHPFLGQHGIPNDITIDPATRVCFLTGPNMAGKSTFLKAFALSTYLAHLGCAVPAKAMAFRPVRSLFSSVQISDSIAAGESFYLAEVRRIRALAKLLGDLEPVVAVIDEPFRGTNVHDAAEASLVLVKRLAAHPNALVFVASHIAELAPEIEGDSRVRLLHFAARMDGGNPAFDYVLREGVSTQRLGMTLLRQEGVLDLLDRW
jgi:DNA mismatch repair ATPase MutS